jgi:hypothetical protein
MCTGDEGENILYVKVIPDFGACCGNVLVGGRSQYGQGFVSIERMNLEAVNICMHELGKITKVRHQLVPNLVICLNEGGNYLMCSVTNAINGVIIYTGVVVIFIAVRIDVNYLSLPGGGIVERAWRNLPAFRENLGLLGGVITP